MLTVEEEHIDKITEVFSLLMKGKKPAPIELPKNYPDNEIKQSVDYINRFLKEYNGVTDVIYALSKGNLNFEAPKGEILLLQSLKNLQANLRHITWTTQQIAQGDFNKRIDFAGELSDAFNSMAKQLQDSFGEREQTNEDLQKRITEVAKTRRAMLNMMEDLKDARKDAETNRARLELALESSNTGLWDLNLISGQAYQNEQWFRQLGYKSDEFTDKSENTLLNLLVHPDDIDGVDRDLDEHISGKSEFYDTKFRLKAKDGSWKWIQSIGKIVSRTSTGKAERMIGVHLDISKQIKAEIDIKESGARLQAIIDSVHSVLFVKDIRGRHLLVNSFFEEAFGVKKEEMIGKTDLDLFEENIAKEIMEIDQRIMISKKPETFEMSVPHADGSTRIHLTEKFPLFDEQKNVYGLCGLATDITHQKDIEKELQQAKKTAEEATQAKSDFLANMSHEIRTPMNAIIGMSHLALKTELTSKQQDYISKVQSSSNSLLGIINDILDFSKIEAGKLDIESINFQLEDVLDNLTNLIGLKAGEKGLELLFNIDQDTPTGLIGDPLRLGQILINLCNNAVKFTEKGEIVVSISTIEKSDGSATLQFSVHDTGIGLTEEQQANLFQAFSQADTSTTRKYGGTGLGLTISKELTGMMGGKIWVESKPDSGSTFIFTAVFGRHSQKRKSFLPEPDLRGKRVLVVDDNQASREILCEMLETMTFEISQATSGEEGLEEVNQADMDGTSYELVFMDWQMPGMDGIAASKEIKNLKLAMPPKIIMVTAYGREEVQQQVREAHLDGFLVKPVTRSLLFDSAMQAFGVGDIKIQSIKIKGENEIEALKSIKGARILLVEDNEINQQVARELLEQAEFVVDLADNGEQAVEMSSSDAYDVILMDIQMPVMNGFDATGQIRERGDKLPIIAMTAHAMAGDREKSLKAGMDDHVTKPIDPDQLFSVLIKWIKPGAREVPEEVLRRKAAALESSDKQQLDLPGFDLKRAIDRMGGNVKAYRKTLGKVVETESNAIERIRQRINEGDFETAILIAHTLKGVAGNIGATALQSVAADLETELMNESNEIHEDLMNQADKQINQTMATIKTALEKGAQLERPKLNGQADIKPLIETLKEQIDNFDSSATESCEVLIEQLMGSQLEPAAKALGKSLDAYDFDQAQVILEELIQNSDA